MHTVSDPNKTRESHFAQADGFYSSDPVQLSKDVAGFYAGAARVDLSGAIAGLICPHAGYAYSGAVAAAAYKQLEGLSYDTVVIISPSHRTFFRGASVYSGGAYRTPLGEVRLDLDFCRKLTAVDPDIMLADIGHDATGGGWEHALEVHLPFLQVVLGRFALVPVVMGDQEYTTAKKLGELIGRYAEIGRTLVIASSDLAHGHDYQTTERLDMTAAEAVAAYSPSTLFDQAAAGAFEACGGGPMTAMMIATQAMGADTAQVVSRRNSADATGDRSGYIVGYLSAVVYQDKPRGKTKEYVLDPGTQKPKAAASRPPSVRGLPDTNPLTDQERKFLLNAARRSLESAIKGTKISCPQAPTERLKQKRGVFVTLTAGDHLRGCIGYVMAYKPLVEAVWEMAESAALRDTRFLPVEPSEVDFLGIEVTVLSPLQQPPSPDHVLIGRHGLLISRGHQAGVLLPQVPVEHDWDRTQFLEQACIKAGLDPDAWKDPDTTIEIFTAEVF